MAAALDVQDLRVIERFARLFSIFYGYPRYSIADTGRVMSRDFREIELVTKVMDDERVFTAFLVELIHRINLKFHWVHGKPRFAIAVLPDEFRDVLMVTAQTRLVAIYPNIHEENPWISTRILLLTTEQGIDVLRGLSPESFTSFSHPSA